MAESEGSLQVIDLDQDEPKAQKFIPVYSKIPRAFSIWIKKSKGGLSFRVAIYSTNFYVDRKSTSISKDATHQVVKPKGCQSISTK